MDKKMTAIFGTAFVLIVLFFVYILVPKDFSTKEKNTNNNAINDVTKNDESSVVVEDTVIPKPLVEDETIRPTDLDLSNVTLQEIDEEITTEEILKVYEVSGPTGKVTFKLPNYRNVELSPDNRFVAIDSEDDNYAFRLYDVVTGKFSNKIKLVTQEDIEKSQGLYWWSPDSKYMAFTKADGMSQDLYIYDVYSDAYQQISTNSLLLCGDSCASEVPFWSNDSKYIGMVEHTRDAGGDYAFTFVTVFDLRGNRVVQSEPIATGDTTTMFRLAWDENNEVTYSYLSYTDEGEEFVQDEPVNLDYSKLK